jgi:2'-5' RNA ligase
VIAAEMEDQLGGLTLLYNRIEQACEAFALMREQRSYQPHVTLARWRPGGARLTWIRSQTHEAAFPGPRFEMSSFALFHSELRPDGANHTVVQRFGCDPNIS